MKKSDELEKKMHAFLVESAQLETAKLTYKTELLNEFRSELETLNASKIELTDKNISLSKELSKAQKIIEALNEDKLFLEEDIESNLVRRQEVMALQSKIEMLSAENQTINRLFQECKVALAERMLC
jgi:chromosome segregation ATPase